MITHNRHRSLSTKERVLAALQNDGGVVSGERLAALCGVSRAAVWKAVNALKAEGYPLRAAGNKGYEIDPSADLLTSECVKRLFEARRQNSASAAIAAPPSITVFQEIDSTNSYAKRLIAASPSLTFADGTLTPQGAALHRSAYIANAQTAGRGRLGRAFDSPKSSGLYFTLIYCPPPAATGGPQRWTTSAAVAVCRTIAALFGVECGVKWVNDIFLDGKKICGILTEGASSLESGTIEAIVTGIGINVRPPAGGFAPELRQTAGALTTKTPPDCPPRSLIAAELLFQLLNVYENESFSNALAEYKRRSIILGKPILVFPLAGVGENTRENTPFEAEALDIDEEARLIVKTARGQTTLNSGEVRIRTEA
jgi:BirA family biotin operon repressor/biotin-[acetyl-CoA-carboxylase] ligase